MKSWKIALVGLAYVGALLVWLTPPATAQDLNTLLRDFLADLRSGTFTIGTADDITLSSDGDGALTIAGNGDGSDENVILNLDDVANTVGVTSGTGATTWSFPGVIVTAAGNCDTTPSYSAAGDTDTGICNETPNEIGVTVANAHQWNWTATDYRAGAAEFLAWSSAPDNPRAAADIGFSRPSAGVVNINDGATATNYRDLRLRSVQLADRATVTVDAATTFAVASGYTVLACTGAETINTITGGATGMVVYLENSDTDCTIADDDDATAANAVDLTGTATNDVGAVKKVIVLIYNGTDWLQVSESDN